MIIANAANGAISIIRLSGEGVIGLMNDCIKVGGKSFFKGGFEKGKLYYAEFDGGEIKDKVMAVYFEKPKSYTGEDMIEIHAHGGVGITNLIIKYFLEKGVRLAENGEFSKRAFLNGKLDLSKAEGVLALINSDTKEQAKNAFKLHDGELKNRVDKVMGEFKQMLGHLSAAIDYPEEGIEEESIAKIEDRIKGVHDELAKLRDSYKEGSLIKNGVDVVLTGQVNVGKSQLMNALVGSDSAIVTDIAGTTRDIIKDSYEYKGHRFNVFDTAGIRESDDKIEQMGIDKAKKLIDKADIVLKIIEIGQKDDALKDNEILIENKLDTKKQSKNQQAIQISALKNINIDGLKEKIYQKSIKISKNEIILTEKRHYDCVLRGCIAIESVLESIKSINIDLIYSDLMVAYQSIGEITGVIATDEIINEVFSKFCVGK